MVLQINMEGVLCSLLFKTDCIGKNIHQQNAKLLGVTFLEPVNIYIRYFTLLDCPYK